MRIKTMTNIIETTATVSEAPAAGHGAVLFVPLNKLKKSPRNAQDPAQRGPYRSAVGQHRGQGMLQNLVVEPETNAEGEPTGSYFVTIGEGRRLAQLRA
jgi:ParB family chromosome partitioning protein